MIKKKKKFRYLDYFLCVQKKEYYQFLSLSLSLSKPQ